MHGSLNLEKVFPTKAEKGTEPIESRLFKAEHVYVCRNKKAKPTVFIPVFPGTNCEYDSAKAFKAAGAEVITRVFKNQSAKEIRESVEVFKKILTNHRLSCFPEAFQQVMSQMEVQNFLPRLFRMLRSKKQL